MILKYYKIKVSQLNQNYFFNLQSNIDKYKFLLCNCRIVSEASASEKNKDSGKKDESNSQPKHNLSSKAVEEEIRCLFP